MTNGAGASGVPQDLDAFIARLRSEGLIISPDPTSSDSFRKARYYIPRVGYYRFSIYYESLKACLHKDANRVFQIGLNDVLKLNKFDRRLRLLSLDALERIEVSVKSYLSSYLTDRFGEAWLKKAAHVFSKGLEKDIIFSVASHPQMRGAPVQDVRDCTGGFIMEALTLSVVENIYQELPEEAQMKIARRFNMQHRILASWLNALRHVRNTSAHHSQLWNKTFDKPPGIPGYISSRFGGIHLLTDSHKKYYAQAMAMYYLLRSIARNTEWHYRLLYLLHDRTISPSGVDLYAEMGFPPSWFAKPFWGMNPDTVRAIIDHKI